MGSLYNVIFRVFCPGCAWQGFITECSTSDSIFYRCPACSRTVEGYFIEETLSVAYLQDFKEKYKENVEVRNTVEQLAHALDTQYSIVRRLRGAVCKFDISELYKLKQILDKEGEIYINGANNLYIQPPNKEEKE